MGKSRAKKGRVDRLLLDATTDEDEDIARQIAEDPDTAPEITKAELKRARVVLPRLN